MKNIKLLLRLQKPWQLALSTNCKRACIFYIVQLNACNYLKVIYNNY